MPLLDAVLAFAVVAGLLTLVPGLDTALVLRSSLTRTRAYAWATALGVATGAMVWGIAAAVGISALLAASGLAYRVLTIAGAAYMLWLGASMIWSSFRGTKAPVDAAVTGAVEGPGGWSGEPAAAPAGSPWRGWLTGAGTNLLNPKVGVFYIATIPQFLPEGISPLLMGAALAGVHAVLTMTWFAVLIIGGRYARRWLSSPRSLSVIDRVTGVVLMGFGGALLAEALTGAAPDGVAAAVVDPTSRLARAG
ncbi:MAG: LysE family translocator [Micrococcus sp.]|nr:LysE family translocator [Micrococcus sp.]